jgi:hypothetical protein
MPDEPNKKMDGLLRNYARQRRGIPDQRMHPATREMLHREVSHIHKREQGSSRFSFRLLSRPRFAFGLALFVILLALILPAHLLRNGTEKISSVANPLPTPSSPLSQAASSQETGGGLSQPVKITEEAPLGVDKLKDSRVAVSSLQKAAKTEAMPAAPKPALNAPLAAAPQPEFEPPPRQNLSNALIANAPRAIPMNISTQARSVGALVASGISTNQRNEAGRSRAALAMDAQFASTADLTNLGNALRLNFTRADTNRMTNPVLAHAMFAPLNSFQVEQLGTKLQIIDSDGSVYTGELEAPPAVKAEQPETESLQTTTLSNRLSPQPETRGFARVATSPLIDHASVQYFHALGTNSTSGLPVNITGKFLERTNQLPSPENTFRYKSDVLTGQKAAKSKMAQRAIVGDVIIGATNRFPLEALSYER